MTPRHAWHRLNVWECKEPSAPALSHNLIPRAAFQLVSAFAVRVYQHVHLRFHGPQQAENPSRWMDSGREPMRWLLRIHTSAGGSALPLRTAPWRPPAFFSWLGGGIGELHRQCKWFVAEAPCSPFNQRPLAAPLTQCCIFTTISLIAHLSPIYERYRHGEPYSHSLL